MKYIPNFPDPIKELKNKGVARIPINVFATWWDNNPEIHDKVCTIGESDRILYPDELLTKFSINHNSEKYRTFFVKLINKNIYPLDSDLDQLYNYSKFLIDSDMDIDYLRNYCKLAFKDELDINITYCDNAVEDIEYDNNLKNFINEKYTGLYLLISGHNEDEVKSFVRDFQTEFGYPLSKLAYDDDLERWLVFLGKTDKDLEHVTGEDFNIVDPNRKKLVKKWQIRIDKTDWEDIAVSMVIKTNFWVDMFNTEQEALKFLNEAINNDLFQFRPDPSKFIYTINPVYVIDGE